jgi:hypothetical protein
MPTPISRLGDSPMTNPARRLAFTGDRPLENEPPDDTGIPATVLAAAAEDYICPATHKELLKSNEKIRRDLDEAMIRIASMGSLMTALNNTLLAQQTPRQTAAAKQLRARPQGALDEPDDDDDDAAEQQDDDDEDDDPDDDPDDDDDSSDDDSSSDDDDDDDDYRASKAGDHCQVAVVSAIDLECHIGALQTLYWYEQQNPEVHSKLDKRWTVNGPTMYDYVEKTRPEVTAAFQAAIAEPGPHVMQAINRFTAAVTAGNRLTRCSMASLLFEGFGRSTSESVAEDARGLVMEAVQKSRKLNALVSSVKSTGMFDREMSEGDGRVAAFKGFKDFEPNTPAGRRRWEKLQEVFTAYYTQPQNRKRSEQKAEKVWGNLQIGSVAEFIPAEKKAFKRWKQAGGDVTDSTRIKNVKGRFNKKMRKAYKQYKKAEAAAGRRDPMLEKKWSRFCKVFERVGKALEEESESDSEQELDQTPIESKRTRRKDNDCFEYFCLGECPYGDECKWNHLGGAAGSKRLEIADTDGNCKQYLKYGNCRRLEKGNCPLIHDPKAVSNDDKDDRPAPGALTSEQHTALIRFAEAKELDATKVSWESVKADGGLDKWAAPPVETQRKPQFYPILEKREAAASYRSPLMKAIVADRSYAEVAAEDVAE